MLLPARRLRPSAYRSTVRHLEDHGDAAARGGRRATRPVFLVLVAGGAEVDVGIDDSGEHVLPGGVDRLASLGKRVVACDGHDHAAIDGDAGAHGSGGRDDRPAPYHEIHSRETHSGVSWRVIRTARGVSRGCVMHAGERAW